MSDSKAKEKKSRLTAFHSQLFVEDHEGQSKHTGFRLPRMSDPVPSDVEKGDGRYLKPTIWCMPALRSMELR